jgi:hypothetical protein
VSPIFANVRKQGLIGKIADHTFANIVCRICNSAKTAKNLEKNVRFCRENFFKHCNFIFFSMNDKMYTYNIQNVSFFLHRGINLKKPDDFMPYSFENRGRTLYSTTEREERQREGKSGSILPVFAEE